MLYFVYFLFLCIIRSLSVIYLGPRARICVTSENRYYVGCVHGGKRDVTVCRPSVCPSIPSFSNLFLTRGQHAMRPAYFSARQ